MARNQLSELDRAVRQAELERLSSRADEIVEREKSRTVSEERYPEFYADASGALPDFTIKDSGQRQQFDSGMVRDVTASKIDWHRVADGPMLKRWAEHLTKGKEKYPDMRPGEPNWLLANGVEEMQRFRQSAFRHFMQWFLHDDDEDHAAAIIFNVNGFEYVRQRLHDGTHETTA